LVGEILASTNLVDWPVIGRFTNTSGVLLFTDSATNFSHRFYRARFSQ